MARAPKRKAPRRAGGSGRDEAERSPLSAGSGDPADPILDAALDLSQAIGWDSVSLGEIAERAGVSMAALLACFPTKGAIVRGLWKRVDREVLASLDRDPLEGDTARDRLFEVLMRRLDALGPRRQAIGSMLRESARDPLACLADLPRFLRSMALMLEAAGLSSEGPSGTVRTKGLGLVYANAVRVWLADESEDLGQTMAALDRGLLQAERCARIYLALAVRGRAGRDGEGH